MSAMNRSQSRPPLDVENGRPDRQPSPSIPPQLRAGPQQQYGRPIMRDPRPALQRQPSRPDQQFSGQPVLQRQRSRPEEKYQEQQPVLQRQRSRPDQEYRATQPVLQRRPDREDQPPQPDLQRQRSRPEQQYPEQPQRSLQRQPSRPDQYYPEQQPRQGEPMPESYTYQQVPGQPVPVAPAFVRAPSTRQPIPNSDSQATLFSPPSRYAETTVIIRGNADDNLDKSDAFWRHFNASAHQQQLPDIEKSSWLEKTQGKTSRTRRTLWIVGIIFAILAAGAIGIGIFLSVRSNSNESRPDTIGGAADITSAGAVAATAGGGGSAAATTSSSLHVSPTNTVP